MPRLRPLMRMTSSWRSRRVIETIIGDKGCLLSGGQQQRLAIARALLKTHQFFFSTKQPPRSTPNQSNKFSSPSKAGARPHGDRDCSPALDHFVGDQIVVMEKGRIKEIGTHAELLENSGYYRRLYDLQFNRNPEEPGRKSSCSPKRQSKRQQPARNRRRVYRWLDSDPARPTVICPPPRSSSPGQNARADRVKQSRYQSPALCDDQERKEWFRNNRRNCAPARDTPPRALRPKKSRDPSFAPCPR